MPQYLLSVYHGLGAQDDPLGTYETAEDRDAALARVSQFNQQLMDEGRFVFACGLTDPNTSITVHADGKPRSAQAPLPEADVFISGFWVVEADDLSAAEQVGLEASEACGQRVEVRQLQEG
ncbi:YciI family protein [Micrococcoides hystricis]|uniref:YciI family protein n=1 Tax=Micrococcoides hystricis TaxID=1572761 RepID=A0ABV6PCG8_9MICC